MRSVLHTEAHFYKERGTGYQIRRLASSKVIQGLMLNFFITPFAVTCFHIALMNITVMFGIFKLQRAIVHAPLDVPHITTSTVALVQLFQVLFKIGIFEEFHIF